MKWLARLTLSISAVQRMMRDKLQQRTESGPFQLRKNFKYFDRDGSVER